MFILKLIFFFGTGYIIAIHPLLALSHKEWAIKPKEYPPKIEAVKYSREASDDQVTDVLNLKVSTTGSALKDSSVVSLYLQSSFENQWIEASVLTELGPGYCWKECNFSKKCYLKCFTTFSLRKPLIGYDLMKESGCGGDGLKQQPFLKDRWRKVRFKSDSHKMLCYLVVVSAQGHSVSTMYPDNCITPPAYGTPVFAHKDTVDIAQGTTANFAVKQNANRMWNTFSLTITQFNRYPFIVHHHLFLCRVRVTQYGGNVNLQNNVPDTDIKVYYRPNNYGSWGSYLLDLNFHSYNSNNGVSRFLSLVFGPSLTNQGVDLYNGCFKCEAQSNGRVARKCIGYCSCN